MGVIKEIVDGSYIIETEEGPHALAREVLVALELDPETNLPKTFKSKRDYKAMLIPGGREKKFLLQLRA